MFFFSLSAQAQIFLAAKFVEPMAQYAKSVEELKEKARSYSAAANPECAPKALMKLKEVKQFVDQNIELKQAYELGLSTLEIEIHESELKEKDPCSPSYRASIGMGQERLEKFSRFESKLAPLLSKNMQQQEAFQKLDLKELPTKLSCADVEVAFSAIKTKAKALQEKLNALAEVVKVEQAVLADLYAARRATILQKCGPAAKAASESTP
jgi:hypothetical protein